MGQFVRTELKEGVFTITLNRPEKLNAITVEMDIDLVRALRTAEQDDGVRAILLHGEGKSFSAGHDLVEVGLIMRELGEAAKDWDNVYAKVWPEGSPVQAVADSKKPVICAVHGYVVGMMVPVVLSCDLIVAADNTIFHEEVLRTGGGAGLAPYVGMIPPYLLNELAMLGQLTAEQLLHGGVLNRVLPLERVMDEARAIAKAATGVLPDSVACYKDGVREVFRRCGVGDPNAMKAGGVKSHGNELDNGFWKRAADTNVREALQWRDAQTGALPG